MNRELDLRSIAKKYEEKLKKIKLALFDVDGVLTNGLVYWSGEECGYNRFFNTHDGYGLKVLMQAGIKVGIITGGNSIGVFKRFTDLGLDYVKMGNEDKREAFKEVLEHSQVALEEVLYMGDEFFDLPILTKVGFSATPPHASHEIRDAVDYVSYREGGQGCVREVIDLVRHAQGIIPKIEY
jgi:3-deoxy-D-manno-octulosonate 8-phosphate phosphatase (KDO 8-P phosphatase)